MINSYPSCNETSSKLQVLTVLHVLRAGSLFVLHVLTALHVQLLHVLTLLHVPRAGSLSVLHVQQVQHSQHVLGQQSARAARAGCAGCAGCGCSCSTCKPLSSCAATAARCRCLLLLLVGEAHGGLHLHSRPFNHGVRVTCLRCALATLHSEKIKGEPLDMDPLICIHLHRATVSLPLLRVPSSS